MASQVFAVERFNWQPQGRRWYQLPGSNRVSVHETQEAADAECLEAEWKIRRVANPFRFGGPTLAYQTPFDPARLFDWCQDLGLEPLEPAWDSVVWARWWETQRPQFTDLQLASLWDVLDRVRFYRVVEQTSGLSCHLVSIAESTDWDYVTPPPEWGSTPYQLARRESTADQTCHDLFMAELARSGYYMGRNSGRGSWRRRDRDPLVDLDPTAAATDPVEYRGYAEHIPLDLVHRKPPHAGQTVYVVLRRHWYLSGERDGWWRWVPGRRSSGRAVAAFDSLEQADALLAEYEARDRPAASLFRFGPPHAWSHLHSSDLWGMLSDLAPIQFASLWDDYRATDRLWNGWWEQVFPDLAPDQLAMVWSLYDRLRFYEVSAVEYWE